MLQDQKVTHDHKPESVRNQAQCYDDDWQDSDSESEPHRDEKAKDAGNNWLIDVSMEQIALWFLFSRIMSLFLNYYYFISLLYLVSVFSLFCWSVPHPYSRNFNYE